MFDTFRVFYGFYSVQVSKSLLNLKRLMEIGVTPGDPKVRTKFKNE